MSDIKQAKRKTFTCHVLSGDPFQVTIQYTVIHKHYTLGNCYYLTGEKEYEIDWYELEGEECARKDLEERFGEDAINLVEEQLD